MKHKFKPGDMVLARYQFPMMELGVILSLPEDVDIFYGNKLVKIHIITQFGIPAAPARPPRIGENILFPISQLVGATTDMIEDFLVTHGFIIREPKKNYET